MTLSRLECNHSHNNYGEFYKMNHTLSTMVTLIYNTKLTDSTLIKRNSPMALSRLECTHSHNNYGKKKH
jgi:hypothetical protein